MYFIYKVSTDAYVLSHSQTGKFGHLLSEKDHEKLVGTIAAVTTLSNLSNKTN